MKIRRTLDDIIKIMANMIEEDNAQRDSNSPLSQTNIICVKLTFISENKNDRNTL